MTAPALPMSSPDDVSALLQTARYIADDGLATAIFFILIFPGNVWQYIDGIDAFGLDTDTERLVRLFFQPVLVLWALWSTDSLKSLLPRHRNKRNQ